MRKLTEEQVEHIRDYVQEAQWSGWGWPGAIKEIASDYGSIADH